MERKRKGGNINGTRKQIKISELFAKENEVN
jgi:hypothetical protein